ncbi:nitrile hydratase subunit beta [Rhizobium leguminosarum]|uniref:SH3-like domain-containing protein n=1 Tax=Rhizobium leguminosarum TaxID=384 RepID=UPI000FF2FD6D|nr:SH3-like domain-containing protein [Rhizobium leguminosarum]RWY80503.1 nitrile hydratase subunit beta [Rhizobium leguminosarum]
MKSANTPTRKVDGVVPAFGELPIFAVGQPVKVSDRAPVGHYRVPTYLRGKTAVVEAIMEPKAVNNEEEAFGRNAGAVRHYYRIAVPMTSIWSDYAGSPDDGLRIEVFETWLEGVSG